jgi:hypothetical protein
VAARERTPRANALRWTIIVVALVLVVWIIASAVVLYQARGPTVDGLDRLEQAREQLGATGLLRGEGTDALAAARADFEAAQDRASSPVLAPWDIVPLLGPNVQSVEDLTEAAADVAKAGERAGNDAAAALKASPASGTDRIALLQRLDKITARAERALQDVQLGPDFFLVSPLGDARERFADRLRQLRDAVRGARAVAQGAQSLLQGPRRYLVLAANNAEMRAGSGMLLSVGVATFANGEFTIGDMRPTAEFNLAPGAVAAPPELAQLWGWMHPTEEWRSLATSPRFDVTAPLAAQMWQAATGETVDGVLAVDAITLQALLAAQGPIVAGGQTLSAENVVDFLLLGQYAGAAITDPQVGRRDVLGEVARGAVDTLASRPWQASDLVAQLSGAGQGRHVLAWARDPAEQAAWAAGGVDGALHDDSLALSILNLGGNKLDQFLDVEAALSVAEVADGGHQVTVRVELRNDAPAGLPSYVSGPYPGTDLVAGEYRGVVALNVPGVGSVPEAEGLDAVVAAGVDGPTKVTAAGELRLTPGETATVTFRFLVPDGFSDLQVESSARVPTITWHFGRQTWEDSGPKRLEW